MQLDLLADPGASRVERDVPDVVRVLGTASREWSQDHRRGEALCAVMVDAIDLVRNRWPNARLELVHGYARGGDKLLASLWPGRCFPFPADWHGPCRPSCPPNHRRYHAGSARSYCPRAGMLRNEDMVRRSRARLCLAFILDDSSGATGCAKLAERAGIETIRFRERSIG